MSEPERKILDAAKQVFERHGFDGARMQQIADETGISKASLHYYFRSKEKLFDIIFEETMTEFLAIVSTWEMDTDTWEVKLRNFVHVFFNFLKTKSMLFIIREIHRNPDLLINWKNSMKSPKKKNRFIGYFEKLQEEGQIQPVDLKIIFIFLHSLCAYPILNQTMFRIATRCSDHDYDQLMLVYPDHVADFLITILRNPKNA